VWKLRDAFPDRFLAVPLDAPIPADVDTWDDYVAVSSRFG
jgi:hypothetical protein